MDMESPYPSSRKSRGLTLIEMLTTLAAMLIVLGVAVPGLQGLIDGNRITVAVNLVVSHLHLARSEAVKRNQRVALCPSHDNTLCSGGFDWTDGAILFTDTNADGVRQPTEARLRRLVGAGAGIRILTSSGRRRIVYEGDGSVLGGSNATFRICSEANPSRNRAVIVSLPGRPRVSKTTADGAKVLCP